MKEKKVRQHKLTDKNPFISSILLTIVCFIIFSVVSSLLNYAISIPVQGYSLSYGPIGLLAGAALGLLFYKRHFRGEFNGFFKYGNLSPVGPLLAAYLIYLAFGFGYDFARGELVFNFNWDKILTALFAGVAEEFTFRGIMTTTLMRKRKNKNSIMVPLLFPAILFGLIHLSNALVGADLLVSCFQSVSAAILGMLLGALYILTGNLVVPMAVHFFHDVIALCFSDEITDTGIMTGTVELSDIVGLVFILGLSAYLFYYVRKQKNIDIAREIWDKKWIIPETPGEV